MKIAVAGTGYVGLSLAVLLSQHNEVHALDIVPEKVEKINSYVSPIQDDEIERFLAEAKAGERELDLHATVDVAEAYTGADYAVIATPTNYDSDRNFFDTSSVEAAIAAVKQLSADVNIPHVCEAMKADEIEVLAKDAMADACFPGNPREATLDDVIELFKKICPAA